MKPQLDDLPPNPYLSTDDQRQLELAQSASANLAQRLSRGNRNLRDCPIRTEFLRRNSERDAVPPMMLMLGSGGGRGGDVRLKLYLSLLWASPGGKHDTEFVATDWAQLLGLPRYSTNGKRRVYEALSWLATHRFIEKQERPGRPSTVIVLHESGLGAPYAKPSSRTAKGKAPTYRRLQSSWWTNAWLAAMSGRALAFWLVLMDESNNGAKADAVWLSEGQTSKKYAISPYLRQRAMRELKHYGLITARREFTREAFGVKSSRTRISIHLDELDRSPIARLE
ncbi:MAG: hypothetical protein KTV68_03615 [Acidimicrobiia bacterium]|nr:hypothetical protein [Acidimicrobiia bacterium]MCY4435228.1 hypothetical protein [bacterium]